MKTWQHDETGRMVQMNECPGKRWFEVKPQTALKPVVMVEAIAVLRKRRTGTVEVLIKRDGKWFVVADLDEKESASLVHDFNDLTPCADDCLPPVLR